MQGDYSVTVFVLFCFTSFLILLVSVYFFSFRLATEARYPSTLVS